MFLFFYFFLLIVSDHVKSDETLIKETQEN